MKYFRLKKQTDFGRLFHKGKRAFSPSLTLVYRPSEKMTMGISVGKKHGKSVVRNRIKRLLREAFRATQPKMSGVYTLLPLKSFIRYDIILLCRYIIMGEF